MRRPEEAGERDPTPQGKGRRMFLNGSLENFSVADILQLLSFSKQTGALHVTGEVTGVLYLDDGEVYFATEEDAAPLEDTVVAAGIPREDWNAALESAGHSHAAGRALMCLLYTSDAADDLLCVD